MNHFFEQFDNIVVVNKPKDDEETSNESKEQ